MQTQAHGRGERPGRTERTGRRRGWGARLLGGAALATALAAGAVAVASPAGAAGDCPFWVPPAPDGSPCVDSDSHSTAVGVATLRTTTEWYADSLPGDTVYVGGTLELGGVGDYTAIVQLRDDAGRELGRREVRLVRTALWELWWKDVQVPYSRGATSVRLQVRNNTSGALSPAKVSRLGD